MCDMMKNNKEMIKQMYRAQGMEMSDQQLEQMTGMMNPEFVKMATDMIANNPNMAN